MSVLKDKYRLEFIPPQLYDKLDKEVRDHIHSYREKFRLLAIKEKKIKRDEQKLKDQKQLLKDMIRGLKDETPFIDHLKSEYNFNSSVIKYKGSNGKMYFNITISRRQKTSKNISLGNEETIKQHLLSYYADNKKFVSQIKDDWIGWLKYETNFGDTYAKIMEMIIDNPYGFKQMTINRHTLFPLDEDR